MKWVRCIKKQSYLSEGKVYKVLESYTAFSYFTMRDIFEDVTLEVERERKLNKILNE